MAKYPLKAWGDPAWQQKVTKTLTVSRVDADIPTVKRDRKPWYIALTQKPELLKEVGVVDGLPDGNTLLLSERDVLALVRYLLEPQTAVWSETPNPTEPGDINAVLFAQPGMVALTDTGEAVNGEANWSPDYFKRQAPLDPDIETLRRNGPDSCESLMATDAHACRGDRYDWNPRGTRDSDRFRVPAGRKGKAASLLKLSRDGPSFTHRG